MNPGVDYYRPFGQPAEGTIIVAKQPATGDTVTVDGTVYTYGTDFGGPHINAVALSLAKAICGDRNTDDQAIFNVKTARTTYAIAIGQYIKVIATQPGSAGNTLAMSTSASTKFTVDALLAGGTDGGISLGSVTLESSNATVHSALVTIADHTTAKVLSATSVPFSSLTVVAANDQTSLTDNVGNVYLATGNNLTSKFARIFASTSYGISAPVGQLLNLNAIYLNVDTDGDGVVLFYS